MVGACQVAQHAAHTLLHVLGSAHQFEVVMEMLFSSVCACFGRQFVHVLAGSLTQHVADTTVVAVEAVVVDMREQKHIAHEE